MSPADKPLSPPRPDLDELLARAQAAFEALSPLEQAAHREAQRQSWARSCVTGQGSSREWRKRRIELLLADLRAEIERGVFVDGLDESLLFQLVMPAPDPKRVIAVEFRMRSLQPHEAPFVTRWP